jgi:hypothetical protein
LAELLPGRATLRDRAGLDRPGSRNGARSPADVARGPLSVAQGQGHAGPTIDYAGLGDYGRLGRIRSVRLDGSGLHRRQMLDPFAAHHTACTSVPVG